MNDATQEIGFEETVRIRAYALWESEGRPHGRDTDHWRLSEDQTRAELATQPIPKKVASKAAPPKKAASTQRRSVAAEHRASL